MKLFIFFFTTVSYLSLAYGIDDVEKRLTALEEGFLDLRLRDSETSFLSISGSFANHVHFIDLDNRSDSTIGKRKFEAIFSTFRLNIDKTNNDRLKFYSTIRSTYMWNRDAQNETDVIDTSLAYLSGPRLLVERAYLDTFFFNHKLSFSVGRLPTISGPPVEKVLNVGRLGTYPLMAYSNIIDGAALTLNLGKILNSSSRNILRFIYSPLLNASYYDDPTWSHEDPVTKAKTLATKGDFYHVNFEHSHPLKFGDVLIIAHAYSGTFGGVSRFITTGAAAGDPYTYEIGTDDKELSKMSSIILYGELSNLFTGLVDLYGTYKKSKIEVKGTLQATVIVDPFGGLGPQQIGDVNDLGGFIYPEDKKGDSYQIGLKLKPLKRFSFGAEYVKVGVGSAPTTLFNDLHSEIYAIPGKASLFYTNFTIFDELTLNVGYTHHKMIKRYEVSALVDTDYRYNVIYTQLRYQF